MFKVKNKNSIKIQEKSNLLHARETHDHKQIFQQTLYRPGKKWDNIQSPEENNLPTENTLPSKAVLQNWESESSSQTKA